MNKKVENLFNGKGLESFLNQIGYSHSPQNPEEVKKYTNLVIDNLPENTSYLFLVIPKRPNYTVPDVNPSEFENRAAWRQYLIDAKYEFFKDYSARMKAHFSSLGVDDYAEQSLDLGSSLVSTTLTSEQAKTLLSSPLIEGIIADHPRAVIKKDMT